MHATKQLLVDVDDVSLRQGNELALEEVSFCLHAGEFIGLIGPNGAGKTTLLKIVLGLLRPTSGIVTAPSAKIGYVPQRGTLYNAPVPMSVMDVVKLGSHGSQQGAQSALDLVSVSELADRRFTELSGGQQQRVIIAKALAAKADILVLDEPTTGIDEQAQAAFYALLGTLQKRGLTIVIVSHEVDTILRLVTRVICLNRSILYDGPPEHFEADKYLPPLYAAHHIKLHHNHGDGHV